MEKIIYKEDGEEFLNRYLDSYKAKTKPIIVVKNEALKEKTIDYFLNKLGVVLDLDLRTLDDFILRPGREKLINYSIKKHLIKYVIKANYNRLNLLKNLDEREVSLDYLIKFMEEIKLSGIDLEDLSGKNLEMKEIKLIYRAYEKMLDKMDLIDLEDYKNISIESLNEIEKNGDIYFFGFLELDHILYRIISKLSINNNIFINLSRREVGYNFEKLISRGFKLEDNNNKNFNEKAISYIEASSVDVDYDFLKAEINELVSKGIHLEEMAIAYVDEDEKDYLKDLIEKKEIEANASISYKLEESIIYEYVFTLLKGKIGKKDLKFFANSYTILNIDSFISEELTSILNQIEYNDLSHLKEILPEHDYKYKSVLQNFIEKVEKNLIKADQALTIAEFNQILFESLNNISRSYRAFKDFDEDFYLKINSILNEFIKAMDKLEEYSEKIEKISLEEYRNLLKESLENRKVRLYRLDKGIDLIRLGEESIETYKVVFILGINKLDSSIFKLRNYFLNKEINELERLNRDYFDKYNHRRLLENYKLSLEKTIETGDKIYLSYRYDGEGNRPILLDDFLNKTSYKITSRKLKYSDIDRSISKDLLANNISRDKRFDQENSKLKDLNLGKINSYSYQMLKTYQDCPYSFFLSYIVGVKEDTDSYGLSLGRIYHGILADYYRLERGGLGKSEYKPDEGLINILTDKHYSYCFPNGNFKEKSDKEIIRENILGLLEFELEKLKESSFRPVEFEKSFGYKQKAIIEKSGKSLGLHGYIDRIDRDEKDNYRIIDYKTSSLSRAELSKDLNQLAFYMLALGQYRFIEANYLIIKDMKYQSLSGEEKIDEIKLKCLDEIFKIDEKIKEGVFPKNVGGLSCQYCPYPSICRKEDD